MRWMTTAATRPAVQVAARTRRNCDGHSSRRHSRSWGTSPRATGASPSRKSARRVRRCSDFRSARPSGSAPSNFSRPANAPDFPLEETLERLYRLAGGQQDLRRLFVQIQLEAALLGNGLSAGPRAVFMRICRALRISPLEFAALEAMLRMRANGAYGPRGSAGGAAPVHARARDWRTPTKCWACRQARRTPR